MSSTNNNLFALPLKERMSLTENFQRCSRTDSLKWAHGLLHTAIKSESWKAACAVPLNQPMFWEASGLQLSNSWGTISFEQDFPRVPGKKRRPGRVLSQTLINQMRELSPLATRLFFFHKAYDFLMKSITDSRGKLGALAQITERRRDRWRKEHILPAPGFCFLWFFLTLLGIFSKKSMTTCLKSLLCMPLFFTFQLKIYDFMFRWQNL